MSNNKRIDQTNEKMLVEVFNDFNSSVGYTTDKINRSWAIGATKKVTLEELFDVMNSPGGRTILQENMLLIKDASVREVLGLEPLTAMDPSTEKIKELLSSGSNKELEEVLQYCTQTTLEKIVQQAISLPVKDMTKGDLIKDYTGRDIVAIVRDRSEDEVPTEETEENAPKRRRIVRNS